MTAGLVSCAHQYTVSGLFFSGFMTGTGDEDWLDLQGQEGIHPNICLQHGYGMDFDFAVYNDGYQICSNVSTNPSTCCIINNAPGHVRVKVWSHSGAGAYTVTIQP